MTRKTIVAVFAVLGALGLTTAEAKDRFGIGVKAGTYGLGADIGVSVSKRIGIRGSLTGGQPSVSFDIDDIEYEGDFSVGGVGVLADIYPFAGQFRVSGGFFANGNEMDLEATPEGDITIGGTTYPAGTVGTLSGTVEWEDTAPYVGVGWGDVARGKNRLRLMVDLGVLFQGSPMVEDLTSSTGVVSDMDLAIEAAKIEDDISDADFWPVVSVGLGIRIF